MAIGCDEISARLAELLYGELPADARAEIEAHVAGCARCQAELAALQRTRAVVRRALDDGEPPARAHQAILRAAAAAVATKQAPAAATAAKDAARPARDPASFWDWFRKRWTWPTLATVGAVAVVALASKIFLEPEKTVDRGRALVHPPVASAPAAAEPPPSAAEPEASKNTAVLKGLDDQEQRARPASSSPPLKRETSASERRRAAPVIGGLSGLASHGKGAVGSGASPRGGPADEVPAAEGFAPPPPAAKPAKQMFAPPPPAAKKSAESRDDLLEGEMERSLDRAPGRAGGGAAPEADRAAPAKAKKEAAADLPREAPAAAAPAPAAPPPATAGEAARTEDKSVAESPVARADRLFAEGRWAEAARAYRELLRRDPRNADAGRWRRRLNAAEAALAPSPP